MNDFKEICGFIVSADPFVQQDSTLSGNGTVNSPLGVVNPLPYPIQFVATSAAATGTNILYVVTGTGA